MGVLTYIPVSQAPAGQGFQSSTSRHGGTDFASPTLIAIHPSSFNPLHRGMGVLTFLLLQMWSRSKSFNPLHRGMGVLTSVCASGAKPAPQCFNPLHRGMGVLTSFLMERCPKPYRFQSSTSRHGGTDFQGWPALEEKRLFQSSTSRHGGTDRSPWRPSWSPW